MRDVIPPRTTISNRIITMAAASTPTHDAPLIACPLCCSEQIQRHDHDFRGEVIFLCHRCKLQFMNPQYTDEHLTAFYAKYTKVEQDLPFWRDEYRTASKEDDLQRIEEFVEPGLFLSVGCGDGLELGVARERGWRVEGYDVDPQVTARVTQKLGTKVHSGDFFELGLSSDHYDCVFLDQVLEHPKNPQCYLSEIHRILKPTGVVFIACPNIHSLTCRWKTAVGKLGLKKRRGNHYSSFHHLFYYSPAVLKNIMQRWHGFHVVVAEGDPLSGLTDRTGQDRWIGRALNLIRRRLPVLESSFRLIAKKASQSQTVAKHRLAAA